MSVIFRVQNEYADEIRAIHSREKPGRAHAKVFVKSTFSFQFSSAPALTYRFLAFSPPAVVSITEVAVPLPTEAQTNFRIALNNGLHSVETASYRLGQNVDIGQEFELYVLPCFSSLFKPSPILLFPRLNRY
jgi:hypothetical protein